MDLAHSVAEEILDALPTGDEDSRWELKSAILLTPPQKGELKKELGKQVSAFANSGGGNLVFGISAAKALEPCEMKVGRQSMKDYLATMVEQSVEHPIRHFRIHQIPFKNEPNNVIFVIEIGDSPAAPHQAKEERQYYYRIDGHSKPAPHFHLELLRSRMTQVVLAIKLIRYELSCSDTKKDSKHATLGINVRVVVLNTSLQAATIWGVLAKSLHDRYRWVERGASGGSLNDGICITGPRPTLLPGETATITIIAEAVSKLRDNEPEEELRGMLEYFGLSLRPVSHNCTGEETRLDWDTPAKWQDACWRLETAHRFD